jgi:lysophospholipase L1-like esterase
VLQRLKNALPRTSCVLVGPTDRPIKRGRRRVKHRPRTDLIIATQKKVSRAMGCGFWDSVKAMGGPLSIVDWANSTPPLAGNDLVHLTGRGYRRLAEDLARALLDGYESGQ